LARKDNKKIYILFASTEKDKNMWVGHLEKLTITGDHLGEEDRYSPLQGLSMIRVRPANVTSKAKRGSQIRNHEGGNSELTISQLNQELQQLRLSLEDEQRAREQLAGLCISLAERVTELENVLRSGNTQSTTLNQSSE